MRRSSINIFLLLNVLMLFMYGCSSDINEEKIEAVEAAERAFEETPEATNTINGDTKFYLPSGYDIEEEDEYNLTLHYKGDTILLFINPNEGADSTLQLDLIKQNAADYIELETFEATKKVGYAGLKEIDENTYELTVGIGGVKITTQTKTSRLANYGEQLMKIANSIEQQ
ncbi:hypothetical protein IEO70_19440 [Bacillus sp. AGMB 02131]|uniref:Lipoprotein n=1 Tax=Peribacillus faecalis TaxID=2772559 RepID=A0A927D3N1_9BACI|nr:hypothetical protein [Peribacillus faecalis]MBD3110504.1 hypothetical protein [Peribacillus faecalis]